MVLLLVWEALVDIMRRSVENGVRLGFASPRAVSRCVSILFLVLTLLPLSGWRNDASALLVKPGQALEVTFTFFDTPPVVPGGVDVLALTTTPFSPSSPGITVDAELFDGAMSLGSGTVASAAIIPFISAGSLFDGVSSNLATVVDGTIDGLIRVTPNFTDADGFIEFALANFNIRAGRGTSAQGQIFAAPFARVASAEVVAVSPVPLPAAFVLLLSGLSLLGGLAMWRLIRN